MRQVNVLGDWVLLNIFIAIITEQYVIEEKKYEDNVDASKIGRTALIEPRMRCGSRLGYREVDLNHTVDGASLSPNCNSGHQRVCLLGWWSWCVPN